MSDWKMLLWIAIAGMVVVAFVRFCSGESICYDPVTNTWYDAQVCSTTSTTSSVPYCPDRVCEKVCRWQEGCICECAELNRQTY